MSIHFLKTTTAIAAATLLAISCTKDAPIKTYPSEINMDNWEQFVDAPNELLQQLKAKQQPTTIMATAVDKADHTIQKTLSPAGLPTGVGGIAPGGKGGKALCIHADVRSWNGTAWTGLSDVQVDYLGLTTYTNEFGRYTFDDITQSPVCMSYPNSSGVAGGGSVNVFDIVMTQRHILGVQTFEQLDIDQAPRRYVAADLNDDGYIDVIDITTMVGLILGTNTNPVIDIAYVPLNKLDLATVTNPAQLGGGIKGNCTTWPDFDIRAIKMGDVTGDNVL